MYLHYKRLAMQTEMVYYAPSLKCKEVNKMYKAFSVRVFESVHDEISKDAEADGRSMNNMIGRIFENYLEMKGGIVDGPASTTPGKKVTSLCSGCQRENGRAKEKHSLCRE